jgi:hypothetical protein
MYLPNAGTSWSNKRRGRPGNGWPSCEARPLYILDNIHIVRIILLTEAVPYGCRTRKWENEEEKTALRGNC